jgi:hypothetical protein
MADELVTVGSPDFRAIEVDGPSGRRYKARDGGMYDMLPGDAAALVREGGFKTGIGPGLSAPGGHVCPQGHRNYLKTCGRCEAADHRAILRRNGFDHLADEGLTHPLVYSAPGEWDHVIGEEWDHAE